MCFLIDAKKALNVEYSLGVRYWYDPKPEHLPLHYSGSKELANTKAGWSLSTKVLQLWKDIFTPIYRWTSLFILFPCACFKASWYHRIASGVSVAQSLSCFHWDRLSDAPERALSMITWPNAHQQHQHRVWYLWVNRNLLSLDDLALQILVWALGSFRKGWGPGEMERCLLSTLLGIKVAETLLTSL